MQKQNENLKKNIWFRLSSYLSMPHCFFVCILLFCFSIVLSITISASIYGCAVENFANLCLLENICFTETDLLPSIRNGERKNNQIKRPNYVRMCNNQTESMEKKIESKTNNLTNYDDVWFLVVTAAVCGCCVTTIQLYIETFIVER